MAVVRPEHNFASVVYSAFLASGAQVNAASFEAAAEALECPDGAEETEEAGSEFTGTYHSFLQGRIVRECQQPSPWLENGCCVRGPITSLPEVPTTYCFDCGQMVPVASTWTKKTDPNHALCEGCFRLAESAGRAKEGCDAQNITDRNQRT